MRSYLEAAVDRALEPLEEGLRNQLVEIVRTSQRELFQSYQAQQLTQRAVLQAHAGSSSSNSQDAAQSSQNARDTDLEAFSMPPPTSDEDCPSIFTSFLGNQPSSFDSGYGSCVWDDESSQQQNPEVPYKPMQVLADANLAETFPLFEDEDGSR